MNLAAPAAGTGSPRGAADRIPKQGHARRVTLYDHHGHAEGSIAPDQAERLEAAGLARLVRSRGLVLLAYRTGATAEFYKWQPKTSGGATVMQARRAMRLRR